jgi:iron complex transport system ATP-binding protein
VNAVPADLLIDIRNCSVFRNRPILDKVSLQVAPFEHTAIVGPNGSGKSTLIRLLMRELYPARGEGEAPVNRFAGSDSWTQADLRQAISLVSMKFAEALIEVGNLTPFDAVASSFFGTYGYITQPLTREQTEATAHALELMHLHVVARQPLQLLSTGQVRKVLIARAMVLKPKLILLDEPSLGLDIAAQSEFLDYLTHAMDTATVLMVTHHLEEILPGMDNVLLMKEGRVFRFGRKDEILTDETLSALFEIPVVARVSSDGVYSMHRG